MKRSIAIALAFAAILALIAFSGPYIHLVTYQEFQNAWNAGKIQPVTSWNTALEAHYPGMSSQFRIPDLAVLPEIPQAPGEAGVLMAWGSSNDDGQNIIAAWQYEFGQDPDLSRKKIHLCVFPPCNITSISFGMQDINGKMKSWDWTVGPGKAVPCSTQVCFWINLAGGAGQAGATSYYMDPGFDITKVAFLMFDENGVWVDSLPPDPGNFGRRAWNYWKGIWIEDAVPVENSSWGRIKSEYSDRPRKR